MTTTFVDCISDSCGDSGILRAGLKRTAGYLHNEGQSFFTWLHQPAGEQLADHGVIICPSIGYEQLHSHRSLRHLADTLARRGVPALRIDWHGTGDSPGTDEDSDRVTTWLSNLRSAIDWMRDEQGCGQISLIGLRLGATLAAMVSNERQIDQLVLWAPVSKGRSFVREMQALGLTADTTADRPKTSNEIEAAGFVLNSQTSTDLGTIDLLKCQFSCQRILVASRNDLPADQRLITHLKSTGHTVDELATAGFAEMMTEPHRGQVPFAALCDISKWLADTISDSTTCATEAETAKPPTFKSTTAAFSTAGGSIHESVIQISRQPHLFGILSEPAKQMSTTLPTIVLLNAGTAYRIGPGRLNLSLARALAASGFRCLRLDLNGVGDSLTDIPDRENESYAASVFRDIERTLEELPRRGLGDRIVLMGLCSGAYAAFQAAAQFKHRQLVESVLINPLTFFWKDGMSLDASPTKELMSFHYYFKAAMDPQKWLKLLSGRSKTGLAGAFRILARRLKLAPRDSAVPSADATDRSTRQVSHPLKQDLARDLHEIDRAGRKVTMIFSASDPGFSILNFHAKRKANELRAKGCLAVSFVENADHTFSKRAARNDLITTIVKHLRSRYR